MTAPGVTAVVLAGGRASRFGGHKLAAELDGRPLLEHVMEAVSTVAANILVAGELPRGAAGTGVAVHVIADERQFEGPLVALARALTDVPAGLAIVVAGDMPWLEPRVLVAMLATLASNEELDAVTLASPAVSGAGAKRRQVLPLAIRVAAVRRAARQAMADGDRSIVRLLDRVRSVEIPASEWLALDPQARTLRDVDRPEDLARMRRELR